jgi:site-specific recombinase XerD
MELEEYKNYLIAKGYTTDTATGMLKTTTKFLTWVNEQGIEITTINYNDITAYIKTNQQRNIKARTTQIIVIHVKHYLNYLVEAGILTHNPALALKLKNTKRKTVYNILSNEELEIIYKTYQAELPSKTKSPPQTLNKLSRKRNKVLLGLLIYQGITAEDIKNLEVKHLELREGKITMPGTKRSNERILKLEPHQIFDLYDYVNEIRKEILRLTKKQSTSLFISIGTGSKLQNTVQKLVEEIKEQNRNVVNLDQIRASIITNWLKQYNKRKVQYMAGHRYVSSTEAYEANNIESLQEDIQRFYPTLG